MCIFQNRWSYHRLNRRASLESGPEQALFNNSKLVLFDFPGDFNAPTQCFILADERKVMSACWLLKLWLGSISAVVAHVVCVVEAFLLDFSGFTFVRLTL